MALWILGQLAEKRIQIHPIEDQEQSFSELGPKRAKHPAEATTTELPEK